MPVDAARVVDLWICCFKAAVGRPRPLRYELVRASAVISWTAAVALRGQAQESDHF